MPSEQVNIIYKTEERKGLTAFFSRILGHIGHPETRQVCRRKIWGYLRGLKGVLNPSPSWRVGRGRVAPPFLISALDFVERSSRTDRNEIAPFLYHWWT